MPQQYVTPWKYHSELLAVRDELFGHESEAPTTASRQRAVSRIRAWQTRKKVYLDIAATADLVEADLHREQTQNLNVSDFSLRAIYATAFMRFVGGHCDAQQKSKEKRPMREIAEEINMPEHWVNLRNELAHESHLPRLQSLMLEASQAQKWLWQNYWAKLPDAGKKGVSEFSASAVKSQVNQAMRDFVRERREEILSKKLADSRTSASSKTCVELVKICQGRKVYLTLLAQCVTESVTPTGRSLGDSMQGSYAIFDGLLRRLSYHQTLFLGVLANELTQVIVGRIPEKPEVMREAALEWIVHLYNSEHWIENAKFGPKLQNKVEEIVVECCLYPSTWSQRLGKALRTDEIEEEYREYFE